MCVSVEKYAFQGTSIGSFTGNGVEELDSYFLVYRNNFGFHICDQVDHIRFFNGRGYIWRERRRLGLRAFPCMNIFSTFWLDCLFRRPTDLERLLQSSAMVSRGPGFKEALLEFEIQDISDCMSLSGPFHINNLTE